MSYLRLTSTGLGGHMHRSRMITAAIMLTAAFGAGAAASFAAPAFAKSGTPSANNSSWHIIEQAHTGSAGQFTALAPLGQDGGWAFNGVAGVTAWERGGSAWTRASFPNLPMDLQVVSADALSRDDVWAFTYGAARSYALRWNGSTWTQVSGGSDLEGGSGLSASDIWAFDGSDVAHWNGSSWTRTSVAGLLPPRSQLNGP